MRVIAGELRGRRLRSVPGRAVRPTGDRLKESLFNILAPRLAGSRFLDLFAGTGAIGIEALSRGAAWVTFVEKDARALQCLRSNLAACRLQENLRIMPKEISAALRQLAASGERFDVVFLDPPYQADLYDTTLERLGADPLVADGGWVVAEHSRGLVLGADYGRLRQFRLHRIGDSALTFFAN